MLCISLVTEEGLCKRSPLLDGRNNGEDRAKARFICQVTDYLGKRRHLIERMVVLTPPEKSAVSWARQGTLSVAGAEAEDLPEELQ